MSKATVRVEARRLPPNATWHEKEENTRKLLAAFKRACTDARVLQSHKEHEFYVKESEKRRRRRRPRPEMEQQQ